MCNYCCEISFMFIFLCFLSEIPCIKKSLSSIECSSFSSNAIYFLFHPLCGQRNEISFRFSLLIVNTKVIIKISFHISQIKGLLVRFFPHAKGTNGFPSIWFWFFVILCRKKKKDCFLFYWKEVEISDFNASTIFILFNSILEDWIYFMIETLRIYYNFDYSFKIYII